MRSLLKLPVRAVAATMLLAFVAVLVFFGLTRTEVGRDGLRGQIERSFGAQFEGSIEIGKLSGNLIADLYATDVRLRDSKGRVVIAADSVVLEPTWRGLLRRSLVLDAATLVRPRIDLVRDADGRWNLADVFTPRRLRTEAGRPLDISAPSIRLLDGMVTTTNLGDPIAAVRSGAVFDFANARLTDLDARAEFRWQTDERVIDIEALSAHLVEPDLRIERLSGTLDLTDGLRLRDVIAVTGGSRVEGDFSRVRPAPGEDAVLDLRLTPSRFSGAEVRALVPALPLADVFDLEADLRGPLDDLTVEGLRLARGASSLAASGAVAGLPDSVAFAGTLASSLDQRDVAAVLPGVPVGVLRRLGRARLDAEGSAAYAFAARRLRLRTQFDARTAAGDAEGSLRLAHSSARPLRIALDADTRDLNPGRLLGDERWAGAITGRVRLDSEDSDLQRLAGSLGLDLDAGTFAGRAFDALAADVTAEGQRFEGSVALAAGGRADVEGWIDLGAARPAADLAVRTDGFDLRRLVPGAPATDLTVVGSLSGETSGSDADLDLVLDFAPSTIALGGTARPIPAHRTALRLRPVGTAPRLDLDSDLVAVQAEGDAEWDAFLPLARQWSAALARTAQVETAKYYRAPPDSLRGEILPLPAPVAAAPQSLALRAEVRRPEALRALVPGFPGLAPGTALDVRTTLAPDRLTLAATARGDSLRAPRVASGAFRASLTLAGDYGETLTERLTLALDVSADTLDLPIGPLADAVAEVRLRDRRLDLDVQSARLGEAGRLGLDASLALRPEVNRLTIRALDVVTAGQTWATPGPQTLDLYADAIRLDEFAVERQDAGATAPRLALRGAVSPLARDSLFVDASALDLDEVFSLLGLRNLFGGRLHAELAVAGVLGQPVVVGEAAIDRFTFAGRRAGRIELDSRFVPGTDAVAVNLHLMPDGDSLSVANDLRAQGTVRFPGTAPDGTRDRGALDLALDIDRLDLFVFDWLFPSIVAGAEGYATGTGRITGVPRVPLFDADLRVRDGRFRVPEFGLALEAEGRVTVDREGFHILNAQLTDKAGGQGLVRGDVLFNDYRFFSFDLTADLAEMEIVDVPDSRDLPFYGYIRATGSATLTGPIDRVFLRAPDARTTPDSEMFIPVTATGPAGDAGFLVFADSLGNVPEFEARRSLISQRPDDERAFLDGLEMNLGVTAPPGSTVHLVFDPTIGDVITAEGSAQLQLLIREGEFLTFGTFDVAGGDYLFTAGDVFTRRFELEPGGTLRWDGDPIDARVDLPATYRTRASLAGLGLPGVDARQRVPLVITLDVTGRVLSPLVDLSIALDESNRTGGGGEALRRRLNQSDRQAEYATSVLLTNSFLLAPSENAQTITDAADELFFTSLSQLVSTRLNLFLNDALGSENVDVLFGVQQGATTDDLDVTYGVALRFLDERLVIRGEGIYQRLSDRPVSDELQGEVAVEVRLGPSVSLEVFYRREGDVLLGSSLSAAPYGAYGAGVNYETDFASWNALLRRIIGEAAEERDEAASAAPF